MAEQLFTVDEVGALTRLHPEVIRREIRRGRLRASRLCRRLRISGTDLQAWVEANRVETAVQP